MYPGRATCRPIRIHTTDSCRRIQVARPGTCRLYLGDIITVLFIYVTVDLYPFLSSNRRATNWRQFCRLYKIHVDGDKWIQLVSGNISRCKRGITVWSLLDWQLLPAVPRGHIQAALSASTTAQLASFSHLMTSQAPALQSSVQNDMITCNWLIYAHQMIQADHAYAR